MAFVNYKKTKMVGLYNKIDNIESFNSKLIDLINKDPSIIYNDIADIDICKKSLKFKKVDFNEHVGITIEEWLIVTYGILYADDYISDVALHRTIKNVKNMQKDPFNKHIISAFLTLDDIQLKQLTKDTISRVYWRTIYNCIIK